MLYDYCRAGVAAPASLLTHRVRGCNEIYHLRQYSLRVFTSFFECYSSVTTFPTRICILL
nr:MAG TPA: hypothetical protein [Caudoviricetes sp.]